MVTFVIMLFFVLPTNAEDKRQWKAAALWSLLTRAVIPYFINLLIAKVTFKVLPALL